MVAAKYPGANIIEIDRTAKGYEIQLWLNNAEVDMHVDTNYQWLFTEFEDMAWTSVPEAVVNSFTQEGYTFNPREDDVDRIEYPNGTDTVSITVLNWIVNRWTSFWFTIPTAANVHKNISLRKESLPAGKDMPAGSVFILFLRLPIHLFAILILNNRSASPLLKSRSNNSACFGTPLKSKESDVAVCRANGLHFPSRQTQSSYKSPLRTKLSRLRGV